MSANFYFYLFLISFTVSVFCFGWSTGYLAGKRKYRRDKKGRFSKKPMKRSAYYKSHKRYYNQIIGPTGGI